MDHSGIFPFVFMVAFVAIMLYVRYVLAEQRRREWRRLAQELGGTLTSAPMNLGVFSLFAAPDPIASVYPHPLFQQGHSRCAPNIMNGTHAGRSVSCFDYQYTVGSGKNSHTYYFLCALVPTPVPFARLCVRPESVADRVFGFLGARDLQLESDEFNRRFHIECDYPRFAFDVLHPRAMEMLLRSSDTCFEGQGTDALIYMSRQYEGQRGLRGSVLHLLQFADEFLALTPAYLATRPDQ